MGVLLEVVVATLAVEHLLLAFLATKKDQKTLREGAVVPAAESFVQEVTW